MGNKKMILEAISFSTWILKLHKWSPVFIKKRMQTVYVKWEKTAASMLENLKLSNVNSTWTDLITKISRIHEASFLILCRLWNNEKLRKLFAKYTEHAIKTTINEIYFHSTICTIFGQTIFMYLKKLKKETKPTII